MRVQLLGELEVRADDGALVEVRGTKQRTLLALLAPSRGRAPLPSGSPRVIVFDAAGWS